MYNYDAIAKAYLAEREKLKSGKYVRKLLAKILRGTTILDVGCGAGVPVDNELVKAGNEVLGIDNSEEQIKLARKLCPGGDYTVRDLENLQIGDYQVGAVVCLYTLFHVPRTKHGQVLKIFRSFLPKGGWMLLSMGERKFEGEHEMYGAKMWSSQWGSLENKRLVEGAGFVIEETEIDRSGGEAHQFILARAK